MRAACQLAFRLRILFCERHAAQLLLKTYRDWEIDTMRIQRQWML
jgi:hypothetical protein